MLKQRIVTAIILALLVFGAIYFLSTPVVAVLLGLVVAIGAWEWAGLSGLESTAEKASYTVIISLLLLFSYPLITSESVLMLFLLLACLWWGLALAVIVYAQMENRLPKQDIRSFLMVGACVLVPSWMSLIYIHGKSDLGPTWVFFLLVIIWSADIGAYFAGRAWGKHKLADQVSPGKSWEGVAGGLVVVFIVVLFYLPFLLHTNDIPPSILVLCLFTVLVSIVGDLSESVVKRIAGVKDSGTILPGHGGVMDRIDSLTAAAPIFTTGLILSGVIL